MLLVPAARELDELARIAGGGSSLRVPPGERYRHHLVGVAVHDELRQAEREPLQGRRQVVAPGPPYRRAAQKLLGRTPRQSKSRRLAQIDHATLRDGAGEPHARVGARRARRQLAARGRPQGELAAGRVTDADDPGEIERLVERAEMIDPSRDVLERRRPPASAAKAKAPVLEVPDRPAAAREVRDEQVLEPEPVTGAPESAVDEHGHGPRGTARGRRQLCELVPSATVRVPSSRDRRSMAAIAPGAELLTAGSDRPRARTRAGVAGGSRGRRRRTRGALRSAWRSPGTAGLPPAAAGRALPHRRVPAAGAGSGVDPTDRRRSPKWRLLRAARA